MEEPAAGAGEERGRPETVVTESARIQQTALLARRANRLVLHAVDEVQLLQAVCHLLVEVGGYAAAWIGLTGHDERNTLRLGAAAGSSVGDFIPAHGSWVDDEWRQGPTGQAIRDAGTVVVRDVEYPLEPHHEPLNEATRAQCRRAVCALPLRAATAVLGALTILDAEAGAFDPGETENLTELADDLAFGILRLRERHEERQAAHRLLLVDRALRTLSAGNRTLLRCVDEAELLTEMCRTIVEVGGYRIAWVGYAEHDPERTIRPMAHAGFDDRALDKVHFTWADTPQGQIPPAMAIRTGKPYIRLDFATDPLLAQFREGAVRLGLNAASSFPLIVDGEILGNLDILASEVDAFGDDELAVLSELAADLSFGISNLRIRFRQREAERTIERMAFADALTGLANRARLHERLHAEIDLARGQQRSLALLVLNLDRFRDVKEVLGYRQGDALLVQVAERLQKLSPPAATLARLGADEFAVLLPRAGAEQAESTARGFSRGFDEPFEVAGTRVELQVSIGVALFPGHGDEPDALMQRADAAMYAAKHSHNSVAIFQRESEPEARERLSLMADLRQAIETDQLRLYCQPKVEISTGRGSGAEALVRWQHPERGLVLPDRFVPLSESTGLINPLTYWVMHAALGQCHAWRLGGLRVPLAVNLSARNLLDPRLLDRLAGLLTTWGADPEWLEFELTESALMQDPAQALEVLQELHAMGFRLYVDDFGTGYSSLSYLQKLPIDALKIDKSFVQSIPSDTESGLIVRSTIEMAHNLGLDVVAEGVESAQIFEQLAGFGADFAQGVYVAEPMPAEQFHKWKVRREGEPPSIR